MGEPITDPLVRAATRQYLVVAVTLGLLLAGANLPVPLYSLYGDHLRFSTGVRTVVVVAYTLAQAPVALFAGRLSDRVGRRRLGLVGLAGMVAGTVLFASVAGTVQLLAARAVYGVSVGLATAALIAWLTELEPAADPARAARTAALVQVAGSAGSPLLSGFLAQYLPYPTILPFVVYLVLLLASIPPIWLAVPETVRRAAAGSTERWGVGLLAGRARPVLVGFCGVTAALTVAVLFVSLVPAYLATLLGQQNLALQGAIVASLFVVSFVAQLLSERWSVRRLLAGGSAAIAAGMLALVLAVPARSLALSALGTTVSGAGLGLGLRAGLTLVNGAAPPGRRGELLAVFYAALYVALSLPVVGVGFGAQRVGLFTAVAVFAGFVIAMSVLTALLGARLPEAAAGAALRERQASP